MSNIETKRMIMVECRATNSVVYKIADYNNVRREFTPGEQKKVPFDELQALSYTTGGKGFIMNFLRIPVDILQELDIDVPPEYHYTDEVVDNIIKNGSLEQFQDLLDFAPEAIKVKIKKMAVELPLTDINKCTAVKDILGFDVMGALRNLQAERDAEKKQQQDANTTTQAPQPVQPIMTDGRQRRAAPLVPAASEGKKVVSSSPANK